MQACGDAQHTVLGALQSGSMWVASSSQALECGTAEHPLGAPANLTWSLLQITWWKQAAWVTDPPAAGSQSQWKPVASASLDMALLFRRPNRAMAPPITPRKGLLPLTPGALGPSPALMMATSKSFALLRKRRHLWHDHSDHFCTEPERRDAPLSPKHSCCLQCLAQLLPELVDPAQSLPKGSGLQSAGDYKQSCFLLRR